jgi:hypothetical protein
MVKKQNIKNDLNIAPDLKVSDHDVMYTGPEPTYPNVLNRKLFLVQSLNWYSRFINKKDTKDLLINYCENNESLQKYVKTLRTTSENCFISSICYLSRLSFRGMKLTELELSKIENEVVRLCSLKQIVKNDEVGEEKASRPNVQEIMKEKTRETAGELEGNFDQYVKDGCKNTFTLKVIDELSKSNILPYHVNIISDIWNKKKTEFESVLTSTDKDLINGYSNFSKSQLKNCVKYCDQVLSELNSYVNIKKVSRAPKTKKAVPIEKKVKDFKYLKEYTEGDLTLSSVSPVKLHGCTECYLYDTELRKLMYFVADSYTKELTIKGTTILGFDTNKSQVKTIRKPEIQIKEFMKLGKPSGRKYFEEIKTVAVVPKGRSNERIIILKAW